MKKLLAAISLIIGLNSNAVLLSCSSEPHTNGEDSHIGLDGEFELDCIQLSKRHDNVVISANVITKGIGWRQNFLKGVLISCPLRKNIRDGEKFYGGHVQADPFIGGSAGVFLGKGACFMGGIEFAFGASIAGASIEFTVY
ncbi:hypothetical protein [Bacteriovorax sp. Seq25_V]|uniref:hypothetical protein n=1 Tax=Bacteriovorax sp. Seq25_V TaxID=1201288 RepID=UPI000389F6F1|nr:hypothetical protein [Bacteriovorax sp. Seq25_V]EQC43856.1 putative lipoprotein [Bacteriovorax sp. Seq25_V]